MKKGESITGLKRKWKKSQLKVTPNEKESECLTG